MSISYPLTLPNTDFRGVSLTALDVVGEGMSPFTLSPQVQQHQGQRWEADIELPPLPREDAEAWITFLLKLKGRWGTCLLRDGVSGTPRGTWAGTPVVDGAHSAQGTALSLKGLSVGATAKAGDYFQLGSGTSARLHKVLDDATADGSGKFTLDIWPHLRVAYADSAAVVSSNAVGLFRLAGNARKWDIGLARRYGLRFSAVEAL